MLTIDLRKQKWIPLHLHLEAPSSSVTEREAELQLIFISALFERPLLPSTRHGLFYTKSLYHAPFQLTPVDHTNPEVTNRKSGSSKLYALLSNNTLFDKSGLTNCFCTVFAVEFLPW